MIDGGITDGLSELIGFYARYHLGIIVYHHSHALVKLIGFIIRKHDLRLTVHDDRITVGGYLNISCQALDEQTDQKNQYRRKQKPYRRLCDTQIICELIGFGYSVK